MLQCLKVVGENFDPDHNADVQWVFLSLLLWLVVGVEFRRPTWLPLLQEVFFHLEFYVIYRPQQAPCHSEWC